MSPYFTKEELKRRAKNGTLAAAGTFAITALSCHRTSQELYYQPDTIKVFKFSGIIAILAGIVWAFMPRAKDNPEDNIAEVKNTVMQPVNVMLGRLLQIQKDANDEIKEARERFWREQRQSSYASNIRNSFSARPGYETKVFTSATSHTPDKSYMKGWNKVARSAAAGSVFDSDDDRDDEPLYDAEIEEFYRELEEAEDRDLP